MFQMQKKHSDLEDKLKKIKKSLSSELKIYHEKLSFLHQELIDTKENSEIIKKTLQTVISNPNPYQKVDMFELKLKQLQDKYLKDLQV